MQSTSSEKPKTGRAEKKQTSILRLLQPLQEESKAKRYKVSTDDTGARTSENKEPAPLASPLRQLIARKEKPPIPMEVSDEVRKLISLPEYKRLNRGVWENGPIPTACILMLAKNLKCGCSHTDVANHIKDKALDLKQVLAHALTMRNDETDWRITPMIYSDFQLLVEKYIEKHKNHTAPYHHFINWSLHEFH